MRAYPTAAISGAGSSGIAAAKARHERGVPAAAAPSDEAVAA